MTINGMETENKEKTSISDLNDIRKGSTIVSDKQGRQSVYNKGSVQRQVRKNLKPKNLRPDGSKTRDSVAGPLTQNKSLGPSSKPLANPLSKRYVDSESIRRRNTTTSSTHRNKLPGAAVAESKKRKSHLSHDSYVSSVSRHSENSTVSRASSKHNASTHILRIPRKIRAKIWNLVSVEDQLILRHVCKIIKGDIDKFVGVRAELDENDDAFEFLIKLGIRKAVVLDLSTFHGEILRHPELLQELWIMGSIRSITLSRLLKECLNIHLLSIQFSKELFSLKPKLFPQDSQSKPNLKILPNLKSLRLQSVTKSELDLKYVANTLIGLIETHLLNEIHLHEISVSIIHRFSHDLIDMCSQIMSVLVCDNCECLQDLRMEVKFQHGPNASVEEMLGLKHDHDTGGGGNHGAYINYRETCPDPQHPHWKDFKNLQQLYFSSNTIEYSCYWEGMTMHINALKTLYCEITNPISWTFYKNFIQGCEKTLESVTLECVDYQSATSASTPLDVDLSIFSKCKRLQLLSMSQSKHPTLKGSRVLNVSKLPRSLQVIKLSWLTVSPTQAFHLVRFSRMRQLRLAYWSSTDTAFGRFLCLLRWGYTLGCTNLGELIIVDLKIRFQNNKRRFMVLLENKNVDGNYIDYNETQLFLKKYS